MEVFDDSSIGLEWEGAYHYDRSIALLMETMQRDKNESSPDTPGDTAPAWETPRYAGSVQGHEGTAQLRSDILLAAVCYPNV